MTGNGRDTIVVVGAGIVGVCTAWHLQRRGADVERLVLARAVLWHSQDRVIRHGNQTIVFA